MLGLAIGVGLVAGVSWWKGRHLSAEIRRLESVVDSAQAVRKPMIDTIKIYAPAVAVAKLESDRLAGLMTVINNTTLEIRSTPNEAPELVTVPAIVIQRIQADSATIARQAAQLDRYAIIVDADSTVIKAQAEEIQKLKGPRCGARCGAAIAVGGIALVKLVLIALF